MTSAANDEAMTIRTVVASLWRAVYLPWISVGLGMAMLAPTLPVYLTRIGYSDSRVGIVIAAAGLGAMLAAVPIGGHIARVGTRNVVLSWLVIMAVATAFLGATTLLVAFIACQLAIGAASIGVRLAGQTEVTHQVPVLLRGRAMSLIGGGRRLMFFVGPLLGGFLAELAGFRITFVIAGALVLAGSIPLVRRLGSTTVADTAASAPAAADAPRGLFKILGSLRVHRRLLAMATFGPLLIMAARTGRFVVLPRMADDLGLSPAMVGAVVAIGTAADLLLFPVSGFLMDRFGRLAAIIPAFSLMTIGLVLLGAAESAIGVTLAGAVIGIGNGLSAGTMLTYASDLAPPEVTSQFFGAFSAIADSGRIIGPLIVGFVADGAGLNVSAWVLAAILVVALGWMGGVVGETRSSALIVVGDER